MSSSRSITFERVKEIALQNVSRIRLHIEKVLYGTVSSEEVGMVGFLGSIKAYIGDGNIIRARSATKAFEDKIVEFIRGLDIRCIGELLEVLPPWIDKRLPAWLYKGAVPCFDEDGWVLVPSN